MTDSEERTGLKEPELLVDTVDDPDTPDNAPDSNNGERHGQLEVDAGGEISTESEALKEKGENKHESGSLPIKQDGVPHNEVDQVPGTDNVEGGFVLFEANIESTTNAPELEVIIGNEFELDFNPFTADFRSIPLTGTSWLYPEVNTGQYPDIFEEVNFEFFSVRHIQEKYTNPLASQSVLSSDKTQKRRKKRRLEVQEKDNATRAAKKHRGNPDPVESKATTSSALQANVRSK